MKLQYGYAQNQKVQVTVFFPKVFDIFSDRTTRNKAPFNYAYYWFFSKNISITPLHLVIFICLFLEKLILSF